MSAQKGVEFMLRFGTVASDFAPHMQSVLSTRLKRFLTTL